MKFIPGAKKFFFGASFALSALSATSALAAQNVIEVDDTQLGVKIANGYDSQGNEHHMLGADLAIWNPPSRYYDMTKALVTSDYSIFRFPNGSLSNDYHWNGAGKYDSTGLWIPSDTSWAPGFLGETIYRGTTKDNYGFILRQACFDQTQH